ncbi:hypothetical protein [Oceanobacillus sp. CF4.6]|uniref:hypothetical protein n=1 Tax=Oceanobacillus sp. CF4.6 TaxID=3373080 RepID=UPI003EE52959
MIDSMDIFAKLDGILTKEAIDKAQNGEHVNEWQRASYAVIINYFANSAGKHSEKNWVKRIAFTYSWLQSVPKSATLSTIDENFITMEKHFLHAKLKKIKFIDTEEEKMIRFKKKQYNLNEFLIPISSMIYEKENIASQLPTLTKFLHFMFPQTFPMFEKNVCKSIFGSSFQSYNRYYSYMEGLKTYMNEGTNNLYIEKIAEKHGISPLYLIDLTLNLNFDAKTPDA